MTFTWPLYDRYMTVRCRQAHASEPPVLATVVAGGSPNAAANAVGDGGALLAQTQVAQPRTTRKRKAR